MVKIFVQENGDCREEHDICVLPRLIKEKKQLFWLDIWKDDPKMRTELLTLFDFRVSFPLELLQKEDSR